MINQAYRNKVAQVESNNDPLAKNPNSTAKGRYQFVDATAQQYGITAEFGTPEYEKQEEQAFTNFSQDNYNSLEKSLERKPTYGELYLAHQQGASGAEKLLKNPDKKATEVLGLDQVLNNGGNEEMTAGEFASQWTNKFAELDEASRPIETSLDASEFSREQVIEEIKRRGLEVPEAQKKYMEEKPSSDYDFTREQIQREIKARGLTTKLRAKRAKQTVEDFESDKPPEPTLSQKVYEHAIKRNEAILDAQSRAQDIGIPAFITSTLPTLGNAVAFMGDVGFELVKSGAETISPEMVELIGDGAGWAVSKVANTPPVKYASDEYREFKQNHPLIAANVEGGVNTALFFYPTAKLATSKKVSGGDKILKQAEEKAKAGVRPAVQIDHTKRALERILKTSESNYGELLDELRSSDVLTIADVAGDEVQGLTRSLGKMKEAKNTIHGLLTQRSDEAISRVSEELTKRVSDVEAYFGNLDELAKARNAAARPLYKKAYDEALKITDERVVKFLADKRIKDAIIEAKQKYGLRLEVPDDSLEALDKAKQVLWDWESSARRAGSDGLATSYKDLRQGLVTVLDDASPTYAKARQVYEHPSKLIDAQKAGRDFSKLRPELLKKKISAMDADELQAYRIGVRDKLQEIVSKTPDGSDPAKRIFGNAEKRGQLEAVFDGSEHFGQFSKRMRDEIATFRTKQAILGGSRTDYNLASDLGFIDSVADASRRGVIDTAIDKTLNAVVSTVKKHYIGITDKNAKELAEILLDRESGIKALEQLLAKQTEFQQRAIIGSAVKNHAPFTLIDGNE